MSLTVRVVGVGRAGAQVARRLEGAGGLRQTPILVEAGARGAASPYQFVLRPAGGRYGDPAAAHEAAEQVRPALEELFQDVDVVVMVAGLGGGTGTGASVAVANAAHSAGAATVGLALMPFSFEGRSKGLRAEAALAVWRERCDIWLALDNNRLLAATGEREPLAQLYERMDAPLRALVNEAQAFAEAPAPEGPKLIDLEARLARCVEGFGVVVSASAPARRRR